MIGSSKSDCDTFGPKHIWYPTNLVPMDKWSPKFGLHGQMVPRIFRLSKGDRLWGSKNMGTKLVGDHLSRGIEIFGIICLWGSKFLELFVYGDQNFGDRIWWGLFVQGDQYGDHLSKGTGSGVPEVRGSNGFGTKCVAPKWFHKLLFNEPFKFFKPTFFLCLYNSSFLQKNPFLDSYLWRFTWWAH